MTKLEREKKMNRDKAGWRERVHVRNSVVQGLNLPLEKKIKKNWNSDF